MTGRKTKRKPPRPPMQLTCDACWKTFMRAPSKYKAKYNFCSEACAWTAHRDAVMGRAERVRILITRSIAGSVQRLCGQAHRLSHGLRPIHSVPPGGGQIQAGAIEGRSEICNNKGLYADAARCEPRKARREATLLMSTPRYGWWAYAKWMIRSYKGGGLMTKAERAAVADAIAETERLADGVERLRLIDLVLWKRTHTLQGAAMAVYVSERTAQEWHRQFIRLVGQKRGLL